MSVIDEVLVANEIYSHTHELRKLTPRPERKLAILTCMDTRLSIRTLGLKTGDAHIIRNAGGIVTDDAVRSLVVSHYLLGTEEIMVINHTDCGLTHSTEHDLRTRIQNRTGTDVVAPAFFIPSATLMKMSATNYRSCTPTPGSPRPSRFADSSTMSQAVFSGRSKMRKTGQITDDLESSKPRFKAEPGSAASSHEKVSIQKIASGFRGDPVPLSIRSGAAMNKNS
jgi:carbonic anhydrase